MMAQTYALAVVCLAAAGSATTPDNTMNSTMSQSTSNNTESTVPSTTSDVCSQHSQDCESCLIAGCAYSFINQTITECARTCSSRTCYSMDPLPVDGHHTPMATECPTPTTSTASTPSTTVGQQTVAPGGTYKTHVQTVHGNTDSSSDSSFAVITGTIVGVLALTVSILLFGYIRVRDNGGFSRFTQHFVNKAASHGGDGDDDLLTQKLLFDGRDSTDVPLLEPSDYDCELDLSQPALDRDYPGVVEGSNRLWAPFTVPTSPTVKSPTREPTSAWRNAVQPERPPSVVRPPSVTGIVLAPVDDVPF
eukprot:m.448087 g.448087  ORF g.448087 m.448087 type:complete len:306 (-) comp19611_c0_seq1:1128-2045(-)